MSLPMKRWPVLAFALASMALGPSIASAAAEWQVIKVNGHDYLSVDNISKFYEMPGGGRSVGVENTKRDS